MSLYFALKTVENNKSKKSVKFHGDMLNFCDFIQVFVFTTNHHLDRGSPGTKPECKEVITLWSLKKLNKCLSTIFIITLPIVLRSDIGR